MKNEFNGPENVWVVVHFHFISRYHPHPPGAIISILGEIRCQREFSDHENQLLNIHIAVFALISFELRPLSQDVNFKLRSNWIQWHWKISYLISMQHFTLFVSFPPMPQASAEAKTDAKNLYSMTMKIYSSIWISHFCSRSIFSPLLLSPGFKFSNWGHMNVKNEFRKSKT